MPNGHIGTRGAQPGNILLGWIPSIEEYTIAIGTPSLYYRAEEPSGSTNAADYTGARPGVYHGSVTFGLPGPSGGCVQLASGAYLTSSTTPLNVANGIVSFWCKIQALPSSTQLLFGFIDSSTVYDKIFTLDSSSNLVFTLNDGTNKTITSANFPVGRWNHVLVTFGSGTASLYVNSVLVNSIACGSSISSYTSNTNVYVGSGSSSPASTVFPGNSSANYDEITVWSGITINQTQINGLYQAGISNLLATGGRVTQLVAETLLTHSPNARVTSVVSEAAVSNNPNARISNLVVEVLRDTHAGSVYSSAVNQTLTFTQNATGGVSGHFYARSLTDHLSFIQTVSGQDAGKGAIQHLAFTETVTTHFVRARTVLQVLNMTDTANIGGTHHVAINQTLAFNDSARIPRYINVLQALTFTQTASPVVSLGATQTLVFHETIQAQHLIPRTLTDKLTFSQSTRISHPAHISQILAFNQNVNTGFSLYQTHDQGTLGDTALGDFTLGVDQDSGGPNGFITDTLAYNQSVSLTRIYHRYVVDNLAFNQTFHTGPFVRVQNIHDELLFLENGSPRTIAVGNGSPFVYTQPTAQVTVVRPGVILQSITGAIVLPSAQFDDGVSTNNKLQILKVMSTKTYSYVKYADRLTLNYSFLLGRPKAIELRNFYIANVDQYIILTNWKGQIFLGKFGSNPLELTTTGRFQNDFESVTVQIEFQGVRVHG